MREVESLERRVIASTERNVIFDVAMEVDRLHAQAIVIRQHPAGREE